MGFMTVSFSLLDEFKATVWRQTRVPDRESLPSFPGGVSYLSAAPTRSSASRSRRVRPSG